MSAPAGRSPDWTTGLGLLACALSAALAGLIEVCLIPVYIGSVIVPVTLLLAVVTNAGLPILVRRLGGSVFTGFVPLLVWIVFVIFLSTARPEGDVLVPGSGAEGDVGLALLAVGVLSGVLSGALQTGHRDRAPAPPRTGIDRRGAASTRGG